jgi:hypothetical protein
MALPTLDQISKARTDARQFGDGTTYALDFNVNGNSYTFIPKNVASNGGVTAGDNTYLLPFFTDAKNWETFNKSASEYDLSSTGLANYLQRQGQSTTGYLVPSSSVSFDSEVRTQPTSTLGGSLSGLKIDETGGIAYGITGGAGSRYLTTSGEVHDPRIEYSSLLGDIFGSVGADIADFVNSDIGKAALLAATVYAGGGFNGSSATQAPTLTGVDAALADLAASAPAFAPEAAAIAAPALTGVDAALADLAASAPAFTPEIIATPVAAELTGVDAALADLANATPAFTGAELAVPAASGVTLKGALDTARAGLLVNALTGDPLGLSDTGGGGASAPTGFAQVPIPEDWKSPTYTYSPVQNVTFEDLFPGVSLQGTQWQNMPQAQTFNEMFASGQQQTPMGSPVDINQIVGSILGQSATS